MFALVIYNAYAGFITSILSVQASGIKSITDLLSHNFKLGYCITDDEYIRVSLLDKMKYSVPRDRSCCSLTKLRSNFNYTEQFTANWSSRKRLLRLCISPKGNFNSRLSIGTYVCIVLLSRFLTAVGLSEVINEGCIMCCSKETNTNMILLITLFLRRILRPSYLLRTNLCGIKLYTVPLFVSSNVLMTFITHSTFLRFKRQRCTFRVSCCFFFFRT